MSGSHNAKYFYRLVNYLDSAQAGWLPYHFAKLRHHQRKIWYSIWLEALKVLLLKAEKMSAIAFW